MDYVLIYRAKTEKHTHKHTLKDTEGQTEGLYGFAKITREGKKPSCRFILFETVLYTHILKIFSIK